MQGTVCDLPDIGDVPQDLSAPAMTDGRPAAGVRVRMTAEGYAGTEVYHALYLPAEWHAGGSFPVIIEYPGNGPYRNSFGDTCTGRVEDCHLGYGLSAGAGFIWACLPFISIDRRRNQLQWWGDVEATAAYCRSAVAGICRDFGGDPAAVVLAGFSRGAIACNFIGLHDDATAALWRAFVCHSHYDGVRRWGYPGDDRASATRRLQRLGSRPQFISHEGSVEATRAFLSAACPGGRFTFHALPFRNHTDSWALRPTALRTAAREWLRETLATSEKPA